MALCGALRRVLARPVFVLAKFKQKQVLRSDMNEPQWRKRTLANEKPVN